MASSSRAGDTAPPDGSDPAPAGTEAERRPETERAGARTSEGAASSAQQRPASSGAASARASGDTITLTTWVGTWNVGNVAPKMDAVTQWLARARGHDLVAVAAQEASYPHSRANLKPEAVWAETLAARRGGDAEAEAARDAARLAAEAGSTASSSDSEEAHDAAGRAASSEDRVNKKRDVFAKKKRGFFGSSKFARASGALAGALAGGVAAGPLAPFGLVAGAAAGYYSSAKVAAELKSRRHWFDLVAAAMGPEYAPVQTATLLQMRLVVFARKKTVIEKRLIQSARVGYQATGLLGAVGNKGGLMVRLRLANGGAVAFVACHLAAHEGEKHVTARDESVAAILRGCWDGSVEKAVGETDVGSAGDAGDAFTNAGETSAGEKALTKKSPTSPRPPRAKKRPTADSASVEETETPKPDRELLACTSHVFVFGDLNYRVDPGVVENESSADPSSSAPRLKKLGWGARWKKTNDAPSGSLVAAVAGLAKKTEKRKNADAAFRRNLSASVAAPKRSEGVEADAADESESEEKKFDADDVSGAAAAMTRWVEGWLAVADLAARGRFDALVEGDQLRREMSRGRALRGFAEAPITFAPTFKLETSSSPDSGVEEDPGRRGDVDVGERSRREYARKRIPSWCDRVLVRSLSPARACRFLTYASCPGVRSSDHAPVYASCELDFPSRGVSGASLLSSSTKRDDERESVSTKNAECETSDASETRRVALRVRVSSFRVALEDDEEEDGRTVSVEDDDDDDASDASSDDGRYDVPGTPLYRAGSRSGRETMMEKLVARAASLKVETKVSETGGNVSAETTSADARTSRNRKRSPKPAGARDGDASSGAHAAMEKLRRGATATVRFSFPFLPPSDPRKDPEKDPKEKEKQKAVETFVAAGVTCRPAQPRIVERDDARSPGETAEFSREGNPENRDRNGFVSRFAPATVTAHWAAASLPVVELGACDATESRDVVRELGSRVAAASVAIDKEHAGTAIIDLGDLCAAFHGAASAESFFVQSGGQTVSAAFHVPFDRFARRRGRAEGTLTLEVVSVGE